MSEPIRIVKPIPVEDLETREPEIQDIELGYGQAPTMRNFTYDLLHDEVFVEGPVVVNDPPEKPAP